MRSSGAAMAACMGPDGGRRHRGGGSGSRRKAGSALTWACCSGLPRACSVSINGGQDGRETHTLADQRRLVRWLRCCSCRDSALHATASAHSASVQSARLRGPYVR